MEFNDIFNTDFLNQFPTQTLSQILITMGLAFILGISIAVIYKRTHTGVLYSADFGITLIAMCLITAMLIMCVVSNVVLSLGMVGALSIVRFRTAIKEPMDIVFLFWSLAGGIILAAGGYILAFVGSLLISLVLLCLRDRTYVHTPYLLILKVQDSQSASNLSKQIKDKTKKSRLKSRTAHKNEIELIYEVRIAPEEDLNIVSDLEKLDGIKEASLISYNGEFLG